VGVPRLVEARRQLQHLGDLRADVAGVDQAQGLVVEVGVEVTLLGQVGDDVVGAHVGQWCEAKATSH